MKIFADLHIHSRHSQATSDKINLENLEKYARIKGLGLLGTGDFTHPKWINEIKTGLKEDGSGILRTATNFPFVLQTEISLAYTQGGKGRRIHHLLLAPGIEIVKQITDFLLTKGRVDYDGRPIFGFSSIELAEKMAEISPDIEIIPGHAWTPYFGVFGSKSGFNSLKECFGGKVNRIHAIETGLSSDPAMNWRIKELDNITLISNSDLHSYWPWKIGREANVFEMKDLTYKNILAAIRERKGFVETVEVDPGYGKYHFDGHKACDVVMSPRESLQCGGICPKCGKKLTIGVLNRVDELAEKDRPEGFMLRGAVPFRSLIPLAEIITGLKGLSIATLGAAKLTAAEKEAWKTYNALIEKFGTEFNVMLEAAEDDLKKVVEENLAAAIMKNREGKIKIKPGYDGAYGEPVFDNNGNSQKNESNKGKEKKVIGSKQQGLNRFF